MLLPSSHAPAQTSTLPGDSRNPILPYNDAIGSLIHRESLTWYRVPTPAALHSLDSERTLVFTTHH